MSWRVAEGNTVAMNDVIVEVETAKSIVELPSPRAGTVVAIHYPEGATVEVGRPIVTIGDIGPSDSEAPTATAPGAAGPSAAAPRPGATALNRSIPARTRLARIHRATVERKTTTNATPCWSATVRLGPRLPVGHGTLQRPTRCRPRPVTIPTSALTHRLPYGRWPANSALTSGAFRRRALAANHAPRPQARDTATGQPPGKCERSHYKRRSHPHTETQRRAQAHRRSDGRQRLQRSPCGGMEQPLTSTRSLKLLANLRSDMGFAGIRLMAYR